MEGNVSIDFVGSKREIMMLINNLSPMSKVPCLSTLRAKNVGCGMFICLPRIDVEVESTVVADKTMDIDTVTLRERNT